MQDKAQDYAGYIAPPPLLYAGTLLLGLLLHLAFPVKFLPRKGSRRLGWLMIGASFLFGPPAFRLMRRAGTSVRPDEPTTALVVEGPFLFTRNPIYVSMTLLYAGIATLFNALWAMLLLPILLFIVNRGVIDREERYLERKFGDEYLRYKMRIPRWF